ncbi:MAG: maltose alpha-D-glucosyltransferase [Spirochaetia bacterium]
MITENNPLWYKDAVIYELHVRSFYDSNGDGMGDFKGLTRKLDYLQDLGVTAIWLLPFYPSPWRDDGYDISDYTGIHEAYGNIRDFRRFLNAAHDRNLKVITELVINHTSNLHPWFERSRRSPAGSKYRDFYVWSDTPEKYSDARIIFQDFETSNWSWDPEAKAYYWHRFYSHQPDLNFENPEVRKQVFAVMDSWFGMGVDGMRLDAVPYLFEEEGTNCENLPRTHQFLKDLREHIDNKHEGKMLLAEANQWPEDAVAYFGDGDECHMVFHFPLMPRLFMSLKMEDRFPITDILEQTPEIEQNAQWSIFLRNHDELTLEMVTDEERDYMYQVFASDPRQRINLGIRRRLAPLLENDRRKIELMNILLFSLPGSPVIYYGDEIGMGDNVYLGDRDGVRTPMQWSFDKNAGFSAANPQRLYLPVIIDPEYHYETVNIENQQANPSSLLWWMKRVIATRRRFRAFSRGTLEFINTNNNHVLAFIRSHEDEQILTIVNFSRYVQFINLDLEQFSGYVPEEVFSQNRFPRIQERLYPLNIGGNEYFWFILKKVEDAVDAEEMARVKEPAFSIRDWKTFSSVLQKQMEDGVLKVYLKNSRWYRQKSKKIRQLKVEERFPVGTAADRSWIVILYAQTTDEKSERYVVPLSLGVKDYVEMILKEHPKWAISRAAVDGTEGIIYDGLYNDDVRNMFLDLLWKRKKLKGLKKELQGKSTRGLRNALKDTAPPYPSRVLGVEQSNSALNYDDRFLLKMYRKIEPGINPDVELTRYLSEKKRFGNIPNFAGSLEYVDQKGMSSSVGILVNFVPNQGDAWEYTSSVLERYYDNVLSLHHRSEEIPKYPESYFDIDPESLPEKFLGVTDGFYLKMIGVLGQRTAEMHLCLASDREDKDLKPEAFSLLYQRSLYQSIRSLVRRVFSSINKAALPESLGENVNRILSLEGRLLKKIGEIRSRKIQSQKIRIHGDYHLGQVIFTGRDFVIIDFEGEPARPMSERRLKFSPIRDVAGMIRSFHYAAYGRLMEYEKHRGVDPAVLEPWAEAWFRMVSGIFLNAYLNAVDGNPILPSERQDRELLLDIFVLEKAVYELGYEVNNRPDWVPIPVAGLLQTLERHGSEK